jgi:hypothetical protein
MASEELITYIKSALEQGHTHEEIKNNLITGGWTEEDIEEAYASVGQINQKIEDPAVQNSSTEKPKETQKRGLFRETPRSLRIYFALGGIFGLIASFQPYFELQQRKQLLELLDVTTGSGSLLGAPTLGIGDYAYIGISFIVAMFLIYMAANMKKFVEKHSTFLVWWLVVTFVINSYGVYAEGRSMWLIVVFGLLATYLIANIKRLAGKPLKQYIPKKVIVLLGIIILGGLGVLGYKVYQEYNKERVFNSVNYDSLQHIEGDYYTDGEYVIFAPDEYSTCPLMSADLGAFEYVGGFFGKDKENVYSGCSLLEGVNPVTFQYLGGTYYGKDDASAFINGLNIKGVDANTFEYLGGRLSKDKNNVYYFTSPIDGINVGMLEYLGGNFTKDGVNVYSTDGVIEAADYDSFVHIGDSYAKDMNNVYFYNKIVEGADVDTFVYVGERKSGYSTNSYAKDKDFVYKDGEVQMGVKPEDCTSNNIYGCGM